MRLRRGCQIELKMSADTSLLVQKSKRYLNNKITCYNCNINILILANQNRRDSRPNSAQKTGYSLGFLDFSDVHVLQYSLKSDIRLQMSFVDIFFLFSLFQNIDLNFESVRTATVHTWRTWQ